MCDNYPSAPCDADDERFPAGADEPCGVATTFVQKMAVAMCTKNTCCKKRGRCVSHASHLLANIHTTYKRTYTKVCLQRSSLREHLTYSLYLYSLNASVLRVLASDMSRQHGKNRRQIMHGWSQHLQPIHVLRKYVSIWISRPSMLVYCFAS